MKKLILMIVVILSFFALPAIGNASYRILLKNGGEFKTLKYWREGDQVKFYIYGGTAGIQKDSIRKIEREKPRNILYGRPVSYQKKEEISSREDNGTDKKAEEKIDLTYYKEKKSRLTADLDRALERLNEATKNRDPEAKERARNEMREISASIYDLTDELKKKNKGELPEGWWEKK